MSARMKKNSSSEGRRGADAAGFTLLEVMIAVGIIFTPLLFNLTST